MNMVDPITIVTMVLLLCVIILLLILIIRSNQTPLSDDKKHSHTFDHYTYSMYSTFEIGALYTNGSYPNGGLKECVIITCITKKGFGYTIRYHRCKLENGIPVMPLYLEHSCTVSGKMFRLHYPFRLITDDHESCIVVG